MKNLYINVTDCRLNMATANKAKATQSVAAAAADDDVCLRSTYVAIYVCMYVHLYVRVWSVVSFN